MVFPRAHRKPFFLPIILVLASAAYSQEGILFVFTSPMGVRFSVDGTPCGTPTPALLRLAPGNHLLSFERPGYRARTESVDVQASSPAFVESVLSPDGVTVGIGEGAEGSRGTGLRLPDGSFAVLGRGSETSVEPVFPGEGMLSAVNVLLPVTAGLALASTALEIFQPRYGHVPFPAVPVLTGILTLSFSGWKFGLELSRRSWHENFIFPSADGGKAAPEAGFRFDEGERALARGDLDAALTFFSGIPYEYPESPLVPFALYNCARIHMVGGDAALARLEFSALIDRYPHPTLYDRSCKNLADLRYRNGDGEEALAALEKMVFADPVHTREAIEAYAETIRNSMKKGGGE